ncbi:MAG: anti-sigma 24 factor [Betaproteobacteria bacterium]|nr:anti-sigma 24 factor [Betaproteobacteria bacterium]
MTEQISALIDDELSHEEVMRVMSNWQSSRQNVEAWGRYHLIGDAMRGSVSLSSDFKQNLMNKLELEPTVLAPSAHQEKSSKLIEFKEKMPRVWSMAASVAAIMLVGWMAMDQYVNSTDGFAVSSAMRGVVPETVVLTQPIPSEYLAAHHTLAPSASSYYVQTVSYAE